MTNLFKYSHIVESIIFINIQQQRFNYLNNIGLNMNKTQKRMIS